MRKLNQKSGFTLVECVVAMAILAIMTLMLAMMMNIIVSLRNDNRKTEEDVDQQVEYLVNEQEVVTESIPNADIAFDDDTVINGDKANKLYYDDPDDSNAPNVQIGAVNYNIEIDADAPAITTKPDNTTAPNNNDIPINIGDKKVYGAIEVNSGITINETKSEEIGNNYIKEWTFEFTATESSYIQALKVVFPVGAKLKQYKGDWSCNVHYLGNRIVRFSPTTNANQGNTQNIKVSIEFTISKDDFVYLDAYNNKVPDNLKHYFTGTGNANSVNLKKIVDGKYNGEFMSDDDPRRKEI